MVTESSMSYLHCTFLDEDAFNLIASINIIVSTPDMVKKMDKASFNPGTKLARLLLLQIYLAVKCIFSNLFNIYF